MLVKLTALKLRGPGMPLGAESTYKCWFTYIDYQRQHLTSSCRYLLLLWPLSFLQCWWLWQWWCSCCLLQVLSECVTLWSHQRWFAFLVILLLNISWQCVCATLETHPQIQSHSSWWWWLWLCLRSLASWSLDLVLHLIIGMKWRLSQAGTAHHNSRLTVTVALAVTVRVPVRYGEAKLWVHM